MPRKLIEPIDKRALTLKVPTEIVDKMDHLVARAALGEYGEKDWGRSRTRLIERLVDREYGDLNPSAEAVS